MLSRRSCFWMLLILLPPAVKAQTVFKNIDVQHYTFSLTLNDRDNNIKGKAEVTVKFLKDVDGFRLNLVKKKSTGKGMLVTGITADGKSLQFKQDSDVMRISAVEQGGSIHNFTIIYSGIPADGLIISTNKFGHRTFFGDNWPDRARNWLPCADYPSDKATVDFLVTAPDHYQVVANGLKVQETLLANHLKLTHWHESVPLPAKVMVLGIANFAIQQSGIVDSTPVYSYVFPENKETGFKSYAYAPAILKFYINKFGPYAYEKLANVQSKTIFGGMENAGAIFYDEKLVGLKFDEELLAHEIAHQWFGDAVTEKSWQNLWLSEGFATYMANCYLESKYGADTLKKREVTDRKKVIAFEKERLSPVVDTGVKNNYMQLLNTNSYEKGSWVLHMLRRKLGDSLFWQGLRNYYAQYKNSNANTFDFEQVMEQTSRQHLDVFFKQWLYTAGHPNLLITWKYDVDKKAVAIHITQKQADLYEFTLQYAINGQVYSIDIKKRETEASTTAPAKPNIFLIDPDVNLLARFEVEAQ
jgi:aminopeptidase N